MRELEKKAKQFAYEAHKGMKRKGKDTPFTYHLELVNKILKTLTTDDEILAAGWLHDVIEDTPITLDELKKEFNSKICYYVDLETEDKSLPWKDRKLKQIEELRRNNFEVALIAYADKMANMTEMFDDYKIIKDVPCEAKVFMSGGISGAGKTTILSKMGIDFQNYATVSSDDFKELLAREDAIPHVEGLTPMEASSLVHEESSHLADRLLLNLANQRKNLIYDFTMKSESTTMTRIGTLNNFGYQNEDIRIVFVDVPLSVSKGRAKTRYMVGLNNFDLGGRWVPSFVADKQKAKTNRFNTANAETLVTMGSKLEAEGFPTPIVYDNTDIAKKIDFNEFKKGYRE